MKWSVILPQLLLVVERACGLTTIWRDGKQEFVDPGDAAICYLHVIHSGDDKGSHDFRQTFNPGTSKIDLTQSGYRLFTVSVLVESYSLDDSTISLDYLERIRDALDRPQIRAGLRAFGLAIRSIAASIDLSSIEEDHAVSAASMDVFFAYANNVTSADGVMGLEPLDWIEKIGGPGTTSDSITPIGLDLDPEEDPEP